MHHCMADGRMHMTAFSFALPIPANPALQERADGTNVGAWHWTEKDVSSWTKQRLGELLGGLQLFSDASGSAATVDVESVEGERGLGICSVRQCPERRPGCHNRSMAATACTGFQNMVAYRSQGMSGLLFQQSLLSHSIYRFTPTLSVLLVQLLKLYRAVPAAGDSIINVRKGKLIATYELAVSVGYRGKAACADSEVRGALKLPYISEVGFAARQTCLPEGCCYHVSSCAGCLQSKNYEPCILQENHDEDPDMQILVSTDVPGAAAVKQGIYANRKVHLFAMKRLVFSLSQLQSIVSCLYCRQYGNHASIKLPFHPAQYCVLPFFLPLRERRPNPCAAGMESSSLVARATACVLCERDFMTTGRLAPSVADSAARHTRSWCSKGWRNL